LLFSKYLCSTKWNCGSSRGWKNQWDI
jgi:hypothetical protein